MAKLNSSSPPVVSFVIVREVNNDIVSPGKSVISVSFIIITMV